MLSQTSTSLCIATPVLRHSPLYADSVVYVLGHHHDTYTGVLLNHLSPVTMKQILAQFGLPKNLYQGYQKTPYIGGLCHSNQLFQLQRMDNQYILSRLSLKQILLLPDHQEDRWIFQGVTQWSKAHFTQEIYFNYWHTLAKSPLALLKAPVSKRFALAKKMLPIDTARYQMEVGHG